MLDAENDSLGNATSTLYLYDDVYTSLMSAKKGKGLSAADLKNVLNGTYAEKEKIASIYDELMQNQKDTTVSENKLCFSMNPEANPVYQVNGLGYKFEENATLQTVSAGNSVSVTVSAGLDGTLINPRAVKLWMKEYTKANRPTKSEDVKKEISKLWSTVSEMERNDESNSVNSFVLFEDDSAETPATNLDGWKLIYDYGKNPPESTVSTKTFSVTMPENSITLGEIYLLAVTGKDIEDIEFKQSDIYGFEGNAAGVAPTFESVKPDNLSIVKSSDETDLKFSGIVRMTTNNFFVKELKATVTVTNEADGQPVGSDVPETYEAVISKDDRDSDWSTNPALVCDASGNWTFIPSKLSNYSEIAVPAGNSYLYNVKMTAKSSSGHSMEVSNSIHIDTAQPVVEISSITPTVTENNKTYVNGNITVKANVSDTNLDYVEAKLFVDGNSTPFKVWSSKDDATNKIKSKYSPEINIATTDLTDEKPMELKITAYDKPGNTFTYSSTQFNSGSAIIISQKTDKPKLTFANGEDSVRDPANINANQNLFGTTNNNRLSISFADDDYLKLITVQLLKKMEDSYVPLEQSAYNTDLQSDYDDENKYLSRTIEKKSSYTWNIVLPEEDGAVYKVKVTVRDSEYSGSDALEEIDKNRECIVEDFYIAVDSGAPSIEILNPVAGSYQSGSISVKGTVTKQAGVEVTGKLYSVAENGDETPVENGAGNGTVATTKTGNGYEWTATATLPSDASGTYKLVYEAIDNYSQKSETSKTFVVDVTPPSFSRTKTGAIFTGETSYSIRGTIDDGAATSGIKGIYFMEKFPEKNADGTYQTPAECAPESANGSFKLFDSNGDLISGWNQGSAVAIITRDAQGNNTSKGKYNWTCDLDLTSTETQDGTKPEYIYFAVVDEAGNVSKIQGTSGSYAENKDYVAAYRDNISPVTTLKGTGLKTPVEGGIATELTAASDLTDDAQYFSNAADGYVLSGEVTEASGKYTVTVNSNVVYDTTDPNYSGNKWEFKNASPQDGMAEYNITVTDGAGNSVTRKVTVVYDKTEPEFSLNSDTDAWTTKKLIYEGNRNYSKGENGTSRYMLSGKWKDATSGTAKLLYKIRHSSDENSWDSDWKEVSDVTKSTAESSWTVYMELAEGVGKAIKIKAIDAVGNEIETTAFDGVTVDFGAPAITVDTTVPQYVKKGESLTITGKYSDSYGIKTLVCKATLDGIDVTSGNKGFTFTTTPVSVENSKSGTWEIKVDPSAGNSEGEWKFGLVAEDLAGRKSDETGTELKTSVGTVDASHPEDTRLSISTTVDTIAPAWKFEWTEASSTKKLTVAGKEYSAETWFNNESLKFAGKYEESGSGIDQIYAFVAAADSLGSAKSNAEDVVSAGTSFSARVDGKFETTLDGMKASTLANKVQFVAVDKAGNLSSISPLDIKVDTGFPIIQIDDSHAGTVLTNGVSPVEISGTASDAASGVGSIEIDVSGNKITVDKANKTAIKDSNNIEPNATGWIPTYKWTTEITSQILASLSGTVNVMGSVKDSAGNTTSASLFKLDMDKTAPSAEISANLTRNGLNGKHEISGKVTEAGTPESLSIYYRNTEPSGISETDASKSVEAVLVAAGWEKFGETVTEVNSIYNWSFKDFNFTENGGVDSSTGLGKVYILPVLTDKAGNCNIYKDTNTNGTVSRAYNLSPEISGSAVAQYTEFTVDQNTDRPVIKFNEISGATGTLRKYTKAITGAISDDDGIEEFKVFASKEKISTISSIDWSKADETGTLSWSKGDTSFTFEPKATEDGEIYVYFRIKDSENGEFTTGDASSLKQPYVHYKNVAEKTGNDTGISYKSDSNPPSFEKKLYFAGTSAQAVSKNVDEITETLPSALTIGGTKKPVLKLVVEAYDAVGLKSIEGELKTQTPVSLTFDEGTDLGNGKKRFTSTLDVSQIPADKSGNYQLVLKLTDISDLIAVSESVLVVDNTGPAVTINSPSSTVTLTGNVTVMGYPTDAQGSEVVDVRYLIVDDDLAELSNDNPELYKKFAAETSQYNAGTINLFEFPFDGETYKNDDGVEKDNPKLPSTLAELEKFTNFTDSQKQIYDIPIYVMAEDELGNYTIKKDFFVHYNPFSDRPTVEILYPDPKSTENILSGSIRLSGSAIDNESVSSVYFQIRPDTDAWNNSHTAANTWTAAKDWANGLYTIATKTDFDSETKKNFDADSNFWGIKADGDVSWYKSINSTGELQIDSSKVGDTTTYKIAVRAVAFDNNNTLGNWGKEVKFTINPAAPNIGRDSSVKQFNASGAETTSKAVTGEVYLKGEWYFVTSVEHLNGIKNISYSITEADGTQTGSGTVVAESVPTEMATATAWDASGNVTSGTGATNGYIVKIPLGTGSGEGTKKIKIDATSGNNIATSASFSFFYDNVAPVIENLMQNSKPFTEGSDLTNSNNQLTFGSTVNDKTAGFEKAFFYFYRASTDGSNGRIYDPYIDFYDGDDPTANPARVSVNDMQSIELAGQKLYGSKQTVTRNSDTTLTLSSDNAHIRVGGAVKIGESFYTIKAKSGTSITLASKCSDSYSEAFFPYAQVVDNVNGERIKRFVSGKKTAATKDDITGDDGDGMPESISGMASSRTWEATIHGDWIPDGSITFVMFAFDKSENVAALTQNGTMANNRPKLAKISLGTDLSGDGNFTDDEFETYSILGKEGASQEVYDLITKDFGRMDGDKYVDSKRKSFTIKDKLAVVPEFVGGNGGIALVFNNNDTTSSPDSDGNAVDSRQQGSGDALISSNSISGTKVSGRLYTLANDKLGDDTADGATKSMSFTFWDSTDESVQGQNSQYSFLRVKDFNVKTGDIIKPKVRVNPFYWNDKTDNSVAKDANGNFLGHIELEDDLTDAIKTALGDEPKVSGKIIFTGTAYDEHRLSQLSFAFGKLSATVGATYDSSTGWTSNSADDGSWEFKVYGEQPAKTNWNFATDTAYFSQYGHKVYWTLTLDTAKLVTDVVGQGQNLTITATDWKNNNSVTTLDSATGLTYAYDVDAKFNKATYGVDVVPYITSLTTTLSKIEKKNPSVYGRSPLGKYPIYAYSKNAAGTKQIEPIIVNGFNLKSGATVTLNNATTTLDDNYSFVIPDATKSGKLSVTVNSIETLNNKNGSDSKGSYEDKENPSTLYENYQHYYNRQANNVNNDTLTDDVEIVIWDINSRSAMTSGEAISEVTMHVNPADGQLGFGFAFGNYASYPYGVNASGAAQTNSYYRWAMDYTPVNTVRFIYDSMGHMFGVHAGTDTNAPRNARFRLTSSLWGVNSNFSSSNDWNNAYSANNALRLEYMGNYQGGKAVLNGTRFLYHPQMASSVKTSTNETNLYLMYYDSMTNELRFRAGAITNNAGFTNQTNTADGTDERGMFAKNTTMAFGDFQDDAYRRSNTANTQVTNYEHVSVLASSSTSANGYNPGQRYSIAVVPDVTVSSKTVDVVVAVWHDPIKRALWYSYMVDPLTNNHQNVDSTTHVNTSWSTPKPILEETYSGGYAAIAVDDDKHVHIASYSKENTGSLIYTYLDSYNSMDAAGFDVKKTSAVVDSYGTTGQNLTIEFAKDDNGKTIPYIGYYLASLQYPKYAYLVDTESSGKNGTTWAPKDGCDEENMFTGAWESIILPTQSDFVVDDFYIGVYRGTDGKLNTIPKIAESLGATNGKCGGNGTSNPVLGYGVNYAGNGYVETAQMR